MLLDGMDLVVLGLAGRVGAAVPGAGRDRAGPQQGLHASGHRR